MDLSACLTRLVEVGVLELALHDTDLIGRYYRFREHGMRLGFRFQVAESDIAVERRSSRAFKREYDRLAP